ncbi:MAG: hypothetical protein K1X50_12575 [Candidatus Promineofilum sp.]|nr:hypothetical protein [Promineifilum sp.]
MSDDLDRWLSPQTREAIEQRYYAEINRRARLETLSHDPSFLAALRTGEPHVGLFSDHGIVHARDVAQQIVTVLERAHGLLIPRRPAWRFASMLGYGVLLAYLHDIGMIDFSAFGRAMHPEYAAQAVLSAEMDDLVAALWHENSGNLAWRLTQLAQVGALAEEPQMVLRELLALTIGHSKSKIPIELLNDRPALRHRLLAVAGADLRVLYYQQRADWARQRLYAARQAGDEVAAERWSTALAAAEREELAAHAAPERSRQPLSDDAFAWLVSAHPDVRALAEDAIDTVRALRAADSLRQRGLVLKSSGGYEMFISRVSGRAVYSLQANDGRLYLLEVPDPLSAGEAILAGSELDGNGDLRIAFHRGAFDTPAATDYAVAVTAGIVDDIIQDTVISFQRAPGEPAEGLKPAAEMRILLEETDDSAGFVARVRQRLIADAPGLRERVRLAPSLREVSERERALYLAGTPITWDRPTRQQFLDRLALSGQRCEGIDVEQAFADVRLVRLRPGEVVIDAGAPAAFVYIPLGEGLRIVPLGGYDTIAARAWSPLGTTGVIHGAARNATVIADVVLEMVMIPKGVYMREWYRTHSPEDFLLLLEDMDG